MEPLPELTLFITKIKISSEKPITLLGVKLEMTSALLSSSSLITG